MEILFSTGNHNPYEQHCGTGAIPTVRDYSNYHRECAVVITVEKLDKKYSVVVEIGKTTFQHTGTKDEVIWHFSHILDTRRLRELVKELECYSYIHTRKKP